MSACCGPSRAPGDLAAPQPPRPDVPLPAEGADRRGMALIPAGSFLMGNDGPDAFPGDHEGPVREVAVTDFWIDRTTVTNAAFGVFVGQTGYVTEAERFGWSFVFAGLLDDRNRASALEGYVPGAPWWTAVRGADWAHPFGPLSGLDDLADHPVVHVSWNDAAAYAAWAGKRLPTEGEWERACRGGLVQARFPWGDELEPHGEHRMNVWQGEFPGHNTCADGYAATAPAESFPPNGFGLYNTTGNVWEWTASLFEPDALAGRQNRALRGGSYLCHESYCNRYRTAGRTSNSPDSSTGHMGFRCAADVDAATAHGADPRTAP